MKVLLISYGVMNKNELKFHVESHIPKEYREKIFCDKCKFVSFSVQSMRSHRKHEHSIDGQLNAHVKYAQFCSICKRGFINRFSLMVCFYL